MFQCRGHHLGCDKKYFTRSGRDRHSNFECSKSKTDLQFYCVVCLVRISRLDNLKLHLNRVHVFAKNIVCDMCGIKLNNTKDYIQHMNKCPPKYKRNKDLSPSQVFVDDSDDIDSE